MGFDNHVTLTVDKLYGINILEFYINDSFVFRSRDNALLSIPGLIDSLFTTSSLDLTFDDGTNIKIEAVDDSLNLTSTWEGTTTA
jgi:hypothetical protein